MGLKSRKQQIAILGSAGKLAYVLQAFVVHTRSTAPRASIDPNVSRPIAAARVFARLANCSQPPPQDWGCCKSVVIQPVLLLLLPLHEAQ